MAGRRIFKFKKEVEQLTHGLNVDPKKFKSKVLHLKVVDGVAVINPKDSLQKNGLRNLRSNYTLPVVAEAWRTCGPVVKTWLQMD